MTSVNAREGSRLLEWRVHDSALEWNGEACVHVWRIALDVPDEQVSTLRTLLTPEELVRAEHYHFARDRRRFVAARGMTRALLGRYLALDARDVMFASAPLGKPYVANTGRADVRFNVSHSADAGVVAVTHGMEVGVDVEVARCIPDRADIARRFFAPSEAAAIARVGADDGARAFLSCWTRKEAYLKGRGTGLSEPLDTFEVPVGPDAPGRLSIGGHAAEEGRWSLYDVSVASEVAAVAVRAARARVVTRTAPAVDLLRGLHTPGAAR